MWRWKLVIQAIVLSGWARQLGVGWGVVIMSILMAPTTFAKLMVMLMPEAV
jgi:hypothetical protein